MAFPYVTLSGLPALLGCVVCVSASVGAMQSFWAAMDWVACSVAVQETLLCQMIYVALVLFVASCNALVLFLLCLVRPQWVEAAIPVISLALVFIMLLVQPRRIPAWALSSSILTLYALSLLKTVLAVQVLREGWREGAFDAEGQSIAAALIASMVLDVVLANVAQQIADRREEDADILLSELNEHGDTKEGDDECAEGLDDDDHDDYGFKVTAAGGKGKGKRGVGERDRVAE